MTSDPSFAIPARPQRRYPAAGGVEYEGSTLFALTPAAGVGDCRALVETVLAAETYRSGEFHDLPMPLWLVRDDETGDVFRVSIRDGAVRLHVLPETESAGLARFYERLVAVSDADWQVERRVDVG
ncbi:MAG: hypothetical protein ABEJ89_06450 [Haloarculaceae archaeon]